jgi:hypothetical protein
MCTCVQEFTGEILKAGLRQRSGHSSKRSVITAAAPEEYTETSPELKDIDLLPFISEKVRPQTSYHYRRTPIARNLPEHTRTSLETLTDDCMWFVRQGRVMPNMLPRAAATVFIVFDKNEQSQVSKALHFSRLAGCALLELVQFSLAAILTHPLCVLCSTLASPRTFAIRSAKCSSGSQTRFALIPVASVARLV